MKHMIPSFLGSLSSLAALRRIVLAALFITAFGLSGGLSGEAVAAQLDDLRAQGLVGERVDGYAEARSGASGEVKNLVKQINAKRKKIYEKRAGEQGVSADQVGRVYAQEILADLPVGSWIKTDKGWRQK